MTFFTKSILSLVLLGSTLIAFFTMFELMGRKEKRFNPKLLRTVHRINGYCFLILFIILSYYCLKIIEALYRPFLPAVFGQSGPIGNRCGVAGPRHYGQFCGLLFYHERGDHSCCFRYGRGNNSRGNPGSESRKEIVQRELFRLPLCRPIRHQGGTGAQRSF